jgi:ATP-dependent helicase/nuclease subunit B
MAGGEPKARVFTIPQGTHFLQALARAVIAGDLPQPGGAPPRDLSDITILLPTRRAARALQEAFLDASGGRAALLPRIKPIAEGNEDLALISAFAGPEQLGAGAADVPPAVGEIERRIVLTSLVQRWSEAMRKHQDEAGDLDQGSVAVEAGAGTAAQAAALAAELARLIDEIETESVDLSGLAGIVPDRFSEHWQKTLEFLQIVVAWWPAYLEERKLLSPMDRRNRLVRAEAVRLATCPSAGPVIVAGVTGSIPATAELMRVVAALPNGAVVIPGLDQTLEPDGWEAILPAVPYGQDKAPPTDISKAPEHPGHPEHPQFGLKRLIEALGVTRDSIQVLPGAEPAAAIVARNRLVSEAMRPARTTERWHSFTTTADGDAVRASLAGVSLIEAATPEDEAEAISLMLREVAETPGRTAALVTRDRLLARRVAIRLETWGIRVDDSAGRPLAKTMPGAFLDLVIEAVATDYAPAAMVALVKHPLTRLGLDAGIVRRTARALEIAAFRTLYLGRGLTGLAAAIDAAEQAVGARERRGRAVERLRAEDWQAVRDLVEALAKSFAPLDDVFAQRGGVALAELVRAHVATAEAIARLPDGDTARGLWAEVAGEAASLFMTGLLDDNLPPLMLPAREYPDLYRSLIAREAVRPKVPLHPRLAIWGPLEARLQQPDVVILGSLNDGIWPELGDPGPWLNRPMRLSLGLPAPEEKIGYAAHDFAMLLGADKVVMTRALKVEGVPKVATRWLLRLGALLDALGLSDALRSQEPWLAWAHWRSHVDAWRPVAAPAPRPAIALRPRKMSVSGVETWMANPYAIFARDILRLEPLPLIGMEPDAALRGSIIHAALSKLAKAHPVTLPRDVAGELMGFARAELEALTGNPRVAAFWLMRLERFAQWFGETEGGRRNGVVASLVEVSGSTVLDGPAGPFTLTARADRIDVTTAGAIITDYKTGASLAKLRKDAQDGFAPQLALEAAIAIASGFAGLATDRIAGLRYISASGGEPAGQEIPLRAEDFAALASKARDGLQNLITQFDDPDTPYSATRRARFSYDFDDYAHLARVLEWSGNGAEVE